MGGLHSNLVNRDQERSKQAEMRRLGKWVFKKVSIDNCFTAWGKLKAS